MRPFPSSHPGRPPGEQLKRGAILLLCALALAVPARAQAPAAPEAAKPEAPRSETAKPETARPRLVDTRTDEVMKRMSAYLAQLQRFALEAEESFDEVSENAPRLQLTNTRRIAVVRPNRFAADATGDTLNRAAVYDGRTLSVVDKPRNAYFTADAPATIDATLDALVEQLGVVVPLSDLAYSDPYAVLMERVLYGEYRGIHQAAGVPCHHLAFTQEDIEWQIWIDAGDKPLPRKVLIAYVDEPGVPQYTATIRRWSLKPEFTDALFKFEAPEGATRIEVGKAAAALAAESAPAASTADAAKQEEKR